MKSVKRHVGHRFLCVLKKCTVYECQQKSGAAKEVHKSEVGQQSTEGQRAIIPDAGSMILRTAETMFLSFVTLCGKKTCRMTGMRCM